MYSIGGMAHFNGISFRSNSGSSRAAEGRMGVTARVATQKQRSFHEFIRRIPLIRGFFALGSFGFFFWGLYLLDILVSFADEESAVGRDAMYVITALDMIATAVLAVFVVLAILNHRKIKRLWQYHGAEHMVINTYNAGKEITVENIAKAGRSAARCGSMFVIVFFIVHIPLLFVPYSDYILPLTFSICYEIFNMLPDVKCLGWLLRLGFFIQERLITAKPDAQQIELARQGFLAVLEITRREDQSPTR